MYLPYLRGKENELRALKEFVESNELKEELIPIIEPIKYSKIFEDTLNTFIKKDKKIIIIHNPKVGNFLKEIDKDKNLKFQKFLKSNNIIVGHILNINTKKEVETLMNDGIKKEKIALIKIDNNNVNLNTGEFKLLIVSEKSYKCTKRAILEDKFNKEARNSDYTSVERLFSNEHNLFKNRKDIGFSDYSIVGSEFSTEGWSPYAIAIHLVFLKEDQKIYIKHFVSDSNNSRNEPAIKFIEAVTKLCEWADANQYSTNAIEEFKNLLKKNHYPGLGVIKKISIKQHLEIINNIL